MICSTGGLTEALTRLDEEESTMDIPIVFSKIADLIMARNQHPITQYTSPLHVPIDDNWEAWMNGSDKERAIADAAETTMAHEMKVPPRCAAVFWNGWLAGLVDFTGGTIAHGEAANEDTLIAAIDKILDPTTEAERPKDDAELDEERRPPDVKPYSG